MGCNLWLKEFLMGCFLVLTELSMSKNTFFAAGFLVLSLIPWLVYCSNYNNWSTCKPDYKVCSLICFVPWPALALKAAWIYSGGCLQHPSPPWLSINFACFRKNSLAPKEWLRTSGYRASSPLTPLWSGPSWKVNIKDAEGVRKAGRGEEMSLSFTQTSPSPHGSHWWETELYPHVVPSSPHATWSLAAWLGPSHQPKRWRYLFSMTQQHRASGAGTEWSRWASVVLPMRLSQHKSESTVTATFSYINSQLSNSFLHEGACCAHIYVREKS